MPWRTPSLVTPCFLLLCRIPSACRRPWGSASAPQRCSVSLLLRYVSFTSGRGPGTSVVPQGARVPVAATHSWKDLADHVDRGPHVVTTRWLGLGMCPDICPRRCSSACLLLGVSLRGCCFQACRWHCRLAARAPVFLHLLPSFAMWAAWGGGAPEPDVLRRLPPSPPCCKIFLSQRTNHRRISTMRRSF